MTAHVDNVAQCICGNVDCTIPYGYCHCGCGEKAAISNYTLPSWLMKKGQPTRYRRGHSHRSRFTIPEGFCVCGKENCPIPYGECHCGCGGKTSIARQTDVSMGMINGKPRKYLMGHGRKVNPRLVSLDGLCVCGDSGCTIPIGICHCGCGERVEIAKQTTKGKRVKGTYNKFASGHHGNKRIRIARMMEQPETVYRRNPNPDARDIERFWSKVDKSPGCGPWGDCWIWTAAKSTQGYGVFGVPEYGTFLAHRFSMLVENGGMPANLMVCHKCDNPPCVNPSHLFMGTAGDNFRDCIKKGRHKGNSSKISGDKHWLSKLTNEQVIEMRKLYKPIGYGYAEIGKKYGISGELVSLILRDKSWKSILTKNEAYR